MFNFKEFEYGIKEYPEEFASYFLEGVPKLFEYILRQPLTNEVGGVLFTAMEKSMSAEGLELRLKSPDGSAIPLESKITVIPELFLQNLPW